MCVRALCPCMCVRAWFEEVPWKLMRELSQYASHEAYTHPI